MKNLFKAICCCSILLPLAFAESQTGSKSKGSLPITVTVDDKTVNFEGTQPIAIKGRIMVPLRGVFEMLGAFVEYDAANHIVTAKRGNEEVDLHLGDRLAKKNGAEIWMEVPASIVGGSTMVPLRFVSQCLGAKVTYDQATNTVSVHTRDLGFGVGGGTTGS